MAFLALLILERGIGNSTLLLMVIFAACKMDDDILYAMGCFYIEKIKGILGCWEVTIHAIGYKSLGIIGMGGCLPRVVGKLNFVARSTKMGGRGPLHSEICNTEKGKGNNNADGDINGGFYKLSPDGFCFTGTLICFFHIAPRPLQNTPFGPISASASPWYSTDSLPITTYNFKMPC